MSSLTAVELEQEELNIKQLEAELAKAKEQKRIRQAKEAKIRQAEEDAKLEQEPHVLVFNDYKGYNDMYMMRLSDGPEFLKYYLSQLPTKDTVHYMLAEEWVAKYQEGVKERSEAWQWLTEGKRSPAIGGRTWKIANVLYLRWE